MVIFIAISLFVVGTTLGSFAGAQVWRLRARQLDEDTDRLAQLHANKQRSDIEQLEYDELRESRRERVAELKQLAPLLQESARTDRSRCLSCQHRLAWYDLIPVGSWLSTGGRCRYCGERIGRFELLIEVGLGLFFAASFLLWPMALDSGVAVVIFSVWLMASIPLAILFAYDAKWFLLPDIPMVIFIGLAAVFALIGIVDGGMTAGSLVSLLGAVAAIGGLYWLLHTISGGTWVGYGDATLGVGLGLLLGRWELAVLAVVLANLIGTILVLPALVTGRLDRQSHIPFGPLLIVGTAIAFFVGQPIIDGYLGLL